MFKEFKSTPTWLQFPFLCAAANDSVYEGRAKTNRHGKMQHPNCYTHQLWPVDSWVYSCMVYEYIWHHSRFDGSCSSFSALDLSNAGFRIHDVHLSQTLLPQPEEHQALCKHGGEKHVYYSPAAWSRWHPHRSPIFMFTLYILQLRFFWEFNTYLPLPFSSLTGISFNEAKLMGLTSSQGLGPIPREMAFPVPKGTSWHDLYDYIRYFCLIQELYIFILPRTHSVQQ